MKRVNPWSLIHGSTRPGGRELPSGGVDAPEVGGAAHGAANRLLDEEDGCEAAHGLGGLRRPGVEREVSGTSTVRGKGESVQAGSGRRGRLGPGCAARRDGAQGACRRALSSPAVFPSEAEGLTRREVDVVRPLAKGLNDRQVARGMVVSQATVKTHLNHVLAKLARGARGSLIAWAWRCGLLDNTEP
ncbi:helix-turn-helix transcriptional regulator [Streptomyces sp. NPDC006733]|uniref:helix-turn-helix transcriptional regulator n=1 Tax=Streptomyces sp. NPDC006733 TaxID=3155460 RepID=UPI0034049BBB